MKQKEIEKRHDRMAEIVKAALVERSADGGPWTKGRA